MGPYRLHWRMLICVGFVVILFNSSCDQSEKKAEEIYETSLTGEQVTRGGIYHAALLNNPATLDPAYVQDQYGAAVVQQLFDGLVRFDPYLMILPALAKTWQVEDNGKSYRFTLQENARFHNGDPVTAEDVVFSLSRLLRIDPSPSTLPHLLKISGAKAYRGNHSEVVTGIQAIDNRVVLIQLEEPYAPFLTALGMYQAKIVPKNEVIRLGDQFGRNPIGSGPFRFISWEADKHILLKGFSKYFSGAAFLDGIDYSIYPGVEIDQILADFQNGNLDEILVSGNTQKALSNQNDLKWFHRPSLSLLFYGIRGDRPPLDNPEFRRRLSTAIDRTILLKQVYGGQFEPAEKILPPGMPGVSKANKTLVEAPSTTPSSLNSTLKGDKNSAVSIEIVSASKSAFAQAELSFIRDAWAQLGVDLEIRYITDWSEFEEYINSDAVQIYRYAWFADMPDPDSFLYPLFDSKSPANFMRFNNKNVDQLLLSARGDSDPAKRAETYREIEALIMESTPIIPLLFLSVDRVYKPFVKGAQPSALGAHYMPLHRVWLKKDTSTP
jgi:ABC-type transport system substrate-binding protein